MKKFLNNKGFTMVELIIVIAIIAVLAAVLAPQYLRFVEDSRESTDVDLASQIESVINTLVASDDIQIASGATSGNVVWDVDTGALTTTLVADTTTAGTFTTADALALIQQQLNVEQVASATANPELVTTSTNAATNDVTYTLSETNGILGVVADVNYDAWAD